MPKSFTTQSFYSILYLAIFSTLIAFLIQNIAQKYTTPTHAAIILSLESVFGCLLSVMLLGDVFTFKMVIGCIIVFAANNYSRNKMEIYVAISGNE